MQHVEPTRLDSTLFDPNSALNRGMALEQGVPSEQGPSFSLPAILMSSAFIIFCGVLGMYIASIVLRFSILFTLLIGLMCMLVMSVPLSVISSAMTGSGNIIRNMGYSCGLTAFTLVVFVLFVIFGATAALIFKQAGVSLVGG